MQLLEGGEVWIGSAHPGCRGESSAIAPFSAFHTLPEAGDILVAFEFVTQAMEEGAEVFLLLAPGFEVLVHLVGPIGGIEFFEGEQERGKTGDDLLPALLEMHYGPCASSRGPVPGRLQEQRQDGGIRRIREFICGAQGIEELHNRLAYTATGSVRHLLAGCEAILRGQVRRRSPPWRRQHERLRFRGLVRHPDNGRGPALRPPPEALH